MAFTRTLAHCLLVVPLVVAGCKRAQAGPEETRSRQSGSRTASESSMASMASGHPADDSTAEDIKRSVAAITADVNHIQMASPADQKKLLPEHNRLVTEMLSRFEVRIRAMHVTADPDWVAVIDSVKTDMKRMPSMSVAELHTFLPEHTRRVMRIAACIDMARL